GGLLVGACMTQRPDLFGACLPAVGVLDMLRYHRFTIGWAWASDYGTVDDDDRVVPAHSFKFAAALQAAQSCPNPVLIRIETRAGHGAGKPTSKIIEEIADRWGFLVRALNM